MGGIAGGDGVCLSQVSFTVLLDNYIAASAQMAADRRLAAPDNCMSQVSHVALHGRNFGCMPT